MAGWAFTTGDQGQHGFAERLGTADLSFGLERIESGDDQFNRCLRVYHPVRNQKCTCAGIKESSRKTRECFGLIVAPPRRRIASGEYDPIGIDVELGMSCLRRSGPD